MTRRGGGGTAVLLALLASAGCGGSEPRERASNPPRRIAAALAPVRRFRPPADGALTDAQVDDFLKVRRAAKGRTDGETARALGIDTDEYFWARARVIEALIALDERRVRESSAEVYAKAIVPLRAARAAARNPRDARVLDEQIAALERERTAVRREETPTPALARNMKTVLGHRVDLQGVAP